MALAEGGIHPSSAQKASGASIPANMMMRRAIKFILELMHLKNKLLCDATAFPDLSFMQ